MQRCGRTAPPPLRARTLRRGVTFACAACFARPGQRPGDCRAVGQPSQAASLAADLVLYVTADGGGLAACGTSAASPPRTRTGSSAILAAAGGACEMDASGRPVAGAINICPARLDLLLASSTAPNVASTDSVVLDVLHEMMHVLAFSEGLYASFASASAKNGSGIAPGPRGGLLVQSPAVLAVARRHFGCPSIRGVPLETEGGNGTARTHWRLRALNGELMVRGVRTRRSRSLTARTACAGGHSGDWPAASAQQLHARLPARHGVVLAALWRC
jgi:hypothetical protein